MPRVHYVKKARKTVKGTCIKKGEPYYWWKFRRGGKHTSPTRPRQSQLTQSDKKSRAYAAAEQLEDISVDADADLDDLKGQVESIADEIEEIASEYRESRENMPEALQDSDVGQLCEENADALESWADEVRDCLDNIDIEEDEELEEGDEPSWIEEARSAIMDAAGNCPI